MSEIMGLRFCDTPIRQLAEEIVDDAANDRRRRIFFVNAHCINVAAKDREYRSILEAEPRLFADGAGMALAAKICGGRLLHNVNGTDLLPKLCEQAAKRGISLALLGSQPGVADACATALEAAHPGLRVAWRQHGYLSEIEENRLLDNLNASGAGILLVAKGVPLQEKWIRRYAADIDVPVLMGVGALLDFYSGSVRRAPKWVRRLRLEWLFRLALEPRRLFRRYVLGNPLFLWRVIRLRIAGEVRNND